MECWQNHNPGGCCTRASTLWSQGIASGFRDAISLAWRLAVACRPSFNHEPAFFKAWWTEGKQQLVKSLESTVRNGNYATSIRTVRSWVYEWGYWAAKYVPSFRRYLETGARGVHMTRYVYEPDLSFIPSDGSGKLLPPIYCVPLSGAAKVQFTEDIIFRRGSSYFNCWYF